MEIEGVSASAAYSAYSAPSAYGVSTARSTAAGAADKPACDCLACAGCKAQGGSAIQNGQQGGGGLNAQGSPEEQAQIAKLRSSDQKVRAHEAAHQAAGAGLTGAAHYQYVRGPDGKQYAVAGEVSIDTSPAGTPEATMAKAKQIRAAALAPADPSPQDRAVAAAASMMESQARAEIAAKEAEGTDSNASNLTDSVGGGRTSERVTERATERAPERATENPESSVSRLLEAYTESQRASENRSEMIAGLASNPQPGSRLSVFA
jgi:hypothetical protein